MIVSLSIVEARTWGDKKVNAEGTTTKEVYKNEFGSREYTVFVPEGLQPNSGLLVVLHGCFMSGEQMINGTLLNQHAAKKKYVVIYPEQTFESNVWKCWNWFKPENQTRDQGESSIIVGMVRDTLKKYNLNASRVFVSGLSAGSAMSANLLGCYSDVFSGALLNSGLEFAAAQSESEAHRASDQGPSHTVDEGVELALNCTPNKKSLVKVLVVHGSSDPHVKIINANRTFEFFTKMNTQIFLKNGGIESQIRSQTAPLEPSPGKYSGELTETIFEEKSMVKKFVMQNMGHGWSGGQASTPYMDPKGIDAAQLIDDEFFN